MSYRLKNSDFKLFLVILGGKASDLLVCMKEGIWLYFGVFCQGKMYPGREVGRECDGVPEWDKMEIRKV